MTNNDRALVQGTAGESLCLVLGAWLYALDGWVPVIVGVVTLNLIALVIWLWIRKLGWPTRGRRRDAA